MVDLNVQYFRFPVRMNSIHRSEFVDNNKWSNNKLIGKTQQKMNSCSHPGNKEFAVDSAEASLYVIIRDDSVSYHFEEQKTSYMQRRS